MEDQIALENRAALQLVQASLGLIPPEVRAASIELTANRAVLHFAVSATTEEVLQDINDIESEFDVLALIGRFCL